jgi:RecB family exonuclease
MQTFVNQLASYIKQSDVELQNWVLILPSERAKQYIRKALFEAYQKPIPAPRMYTIHQWVRQLSPTTIIDRVRLMLTLYEVHVEKVGHKDEIFDEFLHWSRILLADFDEIDRYLIDSKLLFRNLSDIKELEHWSVDNENLSDAQKKFLEFWDRLPGYYEQLSKKLHAKNSVYMGQAYRQLAQNLDRVFAANKDAHFLFAGFNALSPAEISIMKQLVRMGRGHVIFDADAYYLEDENHEAGAFIRDALKELDLPLPTSVGRGITEHEKVIEVIACSQATGQAKVIGTELSLLSEEELKNTLVLLADESLIVPMLNHLPASVGKANITLGLPLVNSSMKTWVELIFKIQESFLKYNKVSVYYKDVMQLWNHPIVLAFLDEEEKQHLYVAEKEIRTRNKIYQQLQKVDAPARVKGIMELLYTPWNNDWNKALKCIRDLNVLIHPLLGEKAVFEKAIIEGFDASLLDFQHCVAEAFPSMSLRSFKSLFNQQWTTDSIAYYGNPIEGLQIMGLLETRLLNFETIFVLGLNEGKMPPTNPIQTMIPMDLRRYMNLPTTREKQGLFAHHFYRLLHTAKRMLITHATAMEGVTANEASRYIVQLELELGRGNSHVKFIKKDYTLDAVSTNTQKVQISKTPEIESRLDELFAAKTSASSIKTFLTCPLDFYYKYVLKFGEEKKVEEEVESNVFGTFIHQVLETMYRPFARRDETGALKEKQPPSLQVEDIESMLKQYELLMRKEFSKHFNEDPEAYERGKNYLSFSMALELTKRFLQKEKEFLLQLNNAPLFIEALEQELSHELEVEVFGKMRKVRLIGFVDRIDSFREEIRIVDYKSGKVADADVGAKMSTFKGFEIEGLVKLCKGSKHFFQLSMYSYLYYQRFQVLPTQSTIISFVNLNDGPFNINPGQLDLNRVVELFPEVLQEFLHEIYDPEIPFEHKEAFKSYCQYC